MTFSGIDPYYYSVEWKRLHDATIKRDGGKCAYCGLKGNQADHVIPRKKGGKDSLSNLVCCCVRCNRLAGGKVFPSLKEKRKWMNKQLHPAKRGWFFRRKKT